MRKNIGNDFALRGFVCCDSCAVPLRSSWAKGKFKHYAYYLCQTVGCDSYGKSIARDKVENDVGVLVKALQPSKTLLKLATAMLRHAWTHQRDQAAEIAKSAARQVADIEKQIESLLDRIMDASYITVIARNEEKIAKLEKQKAVVSGKTVSQGDSGTTFEEKLEPVLTFFANPWKL